MKTEYEKGRERLTPREREEVWGRILQRMKGPRVRTLPRLTLATAGACAVVVLLFVLMHPTKTMKVEPVLGGRPDVLTENRSAGRVAPAATAPTEQERAAPEPPASEPAERAAERELAKQEPAERELAVPPEAAPPAAMTAKNAAPGGAKSPVVTTATPAGPSRDAAAPRVEKAPVEVGSRTPSASSPTAAPSPAPPPTAALVSSSESGPDAAVVPPPGTAPGDRGPLAVAKAQTEGDITGTVRDSTGRPIPYASIVVVGTSWGAIADAAGRFTIRDVPAGTYTLRGRAAGYAEAVIEARAGADLASAVDLVLRPQGGSPAPTGRAIAALKAAPSEPMVRRFSLGAPQDRLLKDESEAPDGRVSARIPTRVPSAAPPVYPETGGSTLPNDEVYDSMYFEHYGVNPFIPTDEDPLSTFAVDVDAASYTVARRYIDLGHLPPKEAVRVEEFVNYFRQDYPDFADTDFRIFLEGAPSPFGKGYYLLRIGLKARTVDNRDRLPANLVFVIDHSGSMAREDRLELVKQALHILVDRLGPEDRIGIVTYDTNGEVLLDPTSLEDRGGRERILDAIDRLQPGGSTNAAEGLTLGYRMADRIYRRGQINRIILCTDGVANEGVTGAESILEQARREADRGIELTAIGFGMGNYNDVLLEKLADKGDGNYYYVDRLEEAQRIFIEKLTGTMQTVARDAKVQVEFDPGRVLRYRLLGFENRDVADRDFRNDRVDAGEIGSGHEVTALYEVKLSDRARRGRMATVRLRYAAVDRRVEGDRDWDRDRGAEGDRALDRDRDRDRDRRKGEGSVREVQSTLDAGDLARSFDRASPRFRLDAAVAEFAEILRRSFWAKESRISDVLPLARRAADENHGDPDVREFARIVERSADLSDKLSPEEQRERENYDMPWSIEKRLGEERIPER